MTNPQEARTRFDWAPALREKEDLDRDKSVASLIAELQKRLKIYGPGLQVNCFTSEGISLFVARQETPEEIANRIADDEMLEKSVEMNEREELRKLLAKYPDETKRRP